MGSAGSPYLLNAAVTTKPTQPRPQRIFSLKEEGKFFKIALGMRLKAGTILSFFLKGV